MRGAERADMRYLLFLLTLACGACAHNAPPSIAKSPDQVTTTTTAKNTDASHANHDVIVSDELTRVCQLHFSNVDQAPKFDLDRSTLLPEDENVLGQIAQCVTIGPLKGKSLHLVGRADPRGEVEYNFILGESRGAAVKHFLSNHGVEASHITTTSRGKLDATGTDEDGWRRDRRVDVMLN